MKNEAYFLEHVVKRVREKVLKDNEWLVVESDIDEKVQDVLYDMATRLVSSLTEMADDGNR